MLYGYCMMDEGDPESHSHFYALHWLHKVPIYESSIGKYLPAFLFKFHVILDFSQ